MSETATNRLLPEHLKAIQSKRNSMAGDLAGLQSDMQGIKSHMARFLRSEEA